MTTALLIIDVQRGLFDEEPRPHEADLVVDRINALARRARAAGAPVIFIQHESVSDALVYGEPRWQLQRRLEAQPGDIRLRKRTPDSFHATELEQLLRDRAITRVVVSGYASEYCVDTTTRRAAALGFGVILAADAHTTHDAPHLSASLIRDHHNVTLPQLTSFGPTITAVASSQVRFE